MLFSVIVPNYNGRQLLESFFLANYHILKNEADSNFEVIVTDDNSTDHSREFIQQLDLPNVRFFLNPGKRGFGSNCGNGAHQASGKYLFFLNTDVVLTEGFLYPLIHKLEHEKVFSVVPKIIRESANSIVESLTTGSVSNCQIQLQFKNKLNKNPDLDHKILWACGAALLCKRALFFELGSFPDEYNPYYVEDVDLSITAWRTGYENWYVGNSVVLHYHNSTTKKECKLKKNFIHLRNSEILNLKHLPKLQGMDCFKKKIIAALIRLNFYKAMALLLAYLKLPIHQREYLYDIHHALKEVQGADKPLI